MLVLLILKMLFVHVYRQYYNYLKITGFFIAFFTFLITGISGGHYLLISEFGTDDSFDKIMKYEKRTDQAGFTNTTEDAGFTINTDPESIRRGKILFDAKCSFCHNARSTEEIVGPGLKGVLKNRTLPASGRRATPGNIIRQFKQPFNRMPSFEYLSVKEISDIIAYLNTL